MLKAYSPTPRSHAIGWTTAIAEHETNPHNEARRVVPS